MLDRVRTKLMLELFVTVLPIHEGTDKEKIDALLGGTDTVKLLYAIQYDIFNSLLISGNWKKLEKYFDFLTDAIKYAKGETELFPNIDQKLMKEFENRKTVIANQIKKWDKDHVPS